MDEEVDAEKFAVSLESLIGGVLDLAEDASAKAVAASARVGAKAAREKAAEGGLHEWSEKYVKGFTSHTDRSGHVAVGEVGNRGKPGLVHLLEKGHATLTGRRTKAYPHMEPAFEEMTEDFVKRVSKYVDEALRK